MIVLLRSIWMFTKFDTVWLMARAAAREPYIRTLPIYAYMRTFTYYRPGCGAALAVIMFLMLQARPRRLLPPLAARGASMTAPHGSLSARGPAVDAGRPGAAASSTAFPLALDALDRAQAVAGDLRHPADARPAHLTLENFAACSPRRAFSTYLPQQRDRCRGHRLLTLAVSAPGAYGLTRFRFPGRESVAGLILFTYMFAPIMIIIPFYILMRQLGIVNTHLGLVLSYTTFCLPFCLWLLRTFFQSIPLELEEAALVDGAGRPQAVIYVVLPLALPGSSRPASSPSSWPGTTTSSRGS